MTSSSGHNGHSADVRMRLLVNGASLPIAQMGPDFLLLDQGIDHPPDKARIILCIDGSERCWEVSLPDGIALDSSRVNIVLDA